MFQNLSIFEKTYELILWLYPAVNKFPKKQRFVLGQHISNTTLKHNATTSDYEIIKEQGSITIDNVGYLMCLDGVYGATTTKEYCEKEQEKQLELNKKWFLESELGRLKMLKYKK